MLNYSHPILSCAEAKAWEASLLRDETAEWAAMQQAGTAIAQAVMNDGKEIGGLSANARLLVLVGKGHNGGDALLAAQAILEQLPRATADIVLCFGETTLRPLARRSLDTLRSADFVTRAQTIQLGAAFSVTAYDLCLDGIFGFQFRPPLDAATAELIARVNAHPQIKLRAAVDLPSGVGETNADTVFRADFTYATGIVKSPVVAEANAPHVGRLRYLDLGFFKGGRVVPDEPSSSARVLLPSLLQPLAQLRPPQTDKRTYGHLFVVGGSRNYPGAVLMTVQAALRSGVGLLTAFVPESLVPEYAARFPEAMWVGMPQTAQGGISPSSLSRIVEKLPRASALVIGPGLGAEPGTLVMVQDLVKASLVPILLDADALRPEVLEATSGKPVICTPHAGEYQRLGSRAGLRHAPVMVLKGPLTRILPSFPPPSASQAEKSPTIYYSLHGGPVLARGGSGDLLAGLIGGLLAQGPDDLLLAAARGVVWHGLAADLLARDRGQVAVQTTQLLEYLTPALRRTL